MTQQSNRIEVANGNKRAVFVRGEKGWRPDWFYQGDRPMLRFKDHEWLSIGHVHPVAAPGAEALPDGGAVFCGKDDYGKTSVAWCVAVRPDAVGGFAVECEFTPEKSVELLEAYATFETPYEYDGTEQVTNVLGMNPVVRWKADERLTPPVWKHPAWCYGREQAARITGPCNAPYLCQTLANADGSNARYTTIVGDWSVCRVHDLFVTPTRSIKPGMDVFDWAGGAKGRGYKFVVGALNWSSAFAKDPNVLYECGWPHRQRVIVDFDSEMPGGALDVMLCRAWQRTAACDFPASGRVAAYDRAVGRGVTWQAATKWLRDVFCGDGVEDLYLRGKGICTYARGTRPKAGGDYGWGWWPQWAGGLHYRAMVLGDKELERSCDEIETVAAEGASRAGYFNDIAASAAALPGFWWVNGPGRGGVLHGALRDPLRRACEKSVAENGKARPMDSGAQACLAEALLLGGETYNDKACLDQGMLLLNEVNAKLDTKFWDFNMGMAGSLVHGGQVRPLGLGHAAIANLIAYRRTKKTELLGSAHRFARYLLSLCYATHNGSQDPDFDWRGWANGSIAGRDQIAEFPPWETTNSLLCLAPVMAEVPDIEEGFFDLLWYIARTGLAQFPAARTLKRVLDENMQARYLPREKIASETDFYDSLPYLAYENPHDQTLLASYQGTDCLLGELVFGGGLARADDDRLCVLVPRAWLVDERELRERLVLVWNPLAEPISTTLTCCWPDGSTTGKAITAPPRRALRLTEKRG